MKRITKQFLINQGFEHDSRSLTRWTYKGIGGTFSDKTADGEGIFYFFDFLPAVMYEDDLLFMKRLIDYQFTVEPSGFLNNLLGQIKDVGMTNEDIKNIKFPSQKS